MVAADVDVVEEVEEAVTAVVAAKIQATVVKATAGSSLLLTILWTRLL